MTASPPRPAVRPIDCRARSHFVVTTDSRHNLPVYPNMARGILPAGINQLWVADVGDDFYHTELLDDGSIFVVLGDVSGKGLDAALLVAAVLGALAIHKQRSPGGLLTDLNQAITGRTAGGFITACAARFYPDWALHLMREDNLLCVRRRAFRAAIS